MVPLLFTVLVTERFPSPSKVANPTPRTGVPLGTFVPSLQSAYLPSKLALEHPSPPFRLDPAAGAGGTLGTRPKANRLATPTTATSRVRVRFMIALHIFYFGNAGSFALTRCSCRSLKTQMAPRSLRRIFWGGRREDT